MSESRNARRVHIIAKKKKKKKKPVILQGTGGRSYVLTNYVMIFIQTKKI